MSFLDCTADGIAFITENESVSYEELHFTADELVALIPKRSVVLFVATNSAETLTAYYSFLSNGIIPLMTSSSIAVNALIDLVSAYRPEFIWCPREFNFNGKVLAEYKNYLLRSTGLVNTQPPHSDLAILLSTSGSTGSQRYVRLSINNIQSNAVQISEYLNIDASERPVTTLPFSYSYGLSIINSHLLKNSTILLTERSLFDRAFWDFFKTNQATSFGGVPYTYQMLQRLRFSSMELPSLRYITQAGGRLGHELHEALAQICANKGIQFFVMYGQTEATARISYLPSQRTLEKIGSIGIAIPNGVMSLVDNCNQSIDQPDTPGELVYQGPNVSMGYATCRADLVKGDEFQGHLATGDVATFDDEGFFYIVGRLKRFLKIYGNRVNLDEVEADLNKNGIIAACVGQDDAMSIFVEQGSLEKAQSLVTSITALNKSAFKVQHIDALPRSEAGKIRYSALEELC